MVRSSFSLLPLSFLACLTECMIKLQSLTWSLSPFILVNANRTLHFFKNLYINIVHKLTKLHCANRTAYPAVNK